MDLTPTRQFRLAAKQTRSAAAEQIPGDLALAQTFARSTPAGLLELVRRPLGRDASASQIYWTEFAHEFMRRLCANLDSDPLTVPPPDLLLQDMVEEAPLMPGGELLNVDYLIRLWEELEVHVLRQISAAAIPARKFMAKEFPAWANAGRIHFHLAETQIDGGQGFTFLATYTLRVPGKARLQHRPLGLALKDAVRSGDRAFLEQLTTPIAKAAGDASFIADALTSQTIYGPLKLNPKQAYQLICDLPACRQHGIVCRVPQWWRGGQPAKAEVEVTLGQEQRPSHVAGEQLVEFDVGVSIGDQRLSKAELDELLEGDDQLVQFQGKWVEINREQIRHLLTVWQQATDAAGDGISFAQAMRLLSGASFGDELPEANVEIAADSDYQRIVAGPQLKGQLSALRQPSSADASATAILERSLRGKLRPYQSEGVAWLQTVTKLGLGGCLADDMGLGKTIQILSLLLLQKAELDRTPKTKRPSLLVLPASLIGNWQAELAKFAPSLSFAVCHSSAQQTEHYQDPSGERPDVDVVFTTYGMVVRHAWFHDQPWHLVIADEAQAIKNADTKQSRALRELKAKVRIAMTGTPVENSLNDLWSLFDFSCPGLLGSGQQFRNLRKRLQGDAEHVDYGPLRRLVRPYILRRRKTDPKVISDLPEKIEMRTACYLTKEQAKLYQAEVTSLAKALDQADGMKRKGLVLKKLMAFKQICNHPSQFDGDDQYQLASSGKFTQLRELASDIAAVQEKVLVFTQFRELTDVLAHLLGGVFGHEGLVLHGGTKVAERQEIVRKFQSDDGPSFLVLSLKAGGTGLNLTAANHVVHFDRWWNPAVENQATDRAFRIGQKKNVLVHKFVCEGTVEEKIDAMIAEKQGVADALMEGGEELRLTELSDSELLDLVRLDIRNVGGSAQGGADA